MADVSQADVELLLRAARKITAEDMPDHKWPPRGMFAPVSETVGPNDDTVGVLLNSDGNIWNIEMILGALCGVERDVQAIKDNAAGNFPAGMWADESNNQWLKDRAQQFAKALVPLCGLLPALALAAQANATPPDAAPAKKAPAKKAPKKRST